MTEVSPKILKKLQTLDKMAADLRKGQHFKITRLTMLKSLCEDPEASAHFSLFLAKKAHQQLKTVGRRTSKKKQKYQRLASKAVREMNKYLKKPDRKAKPTVFEEPKLYEIRRELREVQNTYKKHRWGMVRIIESRELLIVETALECFLSSMASAELGYRAARQYAERSDPRYPSGLIPASAPFVEDIAEFWGRYFLGRGWRKHLKK